MHAARMEDEKYVHSFDRKTYMKETTWETYF
jgi:hypothetical protein